MSQPAKSTFPSRWGRRRRAFGSRARVRGAARASLPRVGVRGAARSLAGTAEGSRTLRPKLEDHKLVFCQPNRTYYSTDRLGARFPRVPGRNEGRGEDLEREAMADVISEKKRRRLAGTIPNPTLTARVIPDFGLLLTSRQASRNQTPLMPIADHRSAHSRNTQLSCQSRRRCGRRSRNDLTPETKKRQSCRNRERNEHS